MTDHPKMDREEIVKAIHDRLAYHRPAIETRDPQALAFGAQFLAALGAPLHGAMTALAAAWGLQREHLSAWLRGDWERSGPPMVVLWQVLTSPTREAREAGRALLRLLADHYGYDVVPRQGAIAELRELPARVYRASGDLAGAISEAVADGQVDERECDRIEAHLRDRDQETASIRATLAAARRRT